MYLDIRPKRPQSGKPGLVWVIWTGLLNIGRVDLRKDVVNPWRVPDRDWKGRHSRRLLDDRASTTAISPAFKGIKTVVQLLGDASWSAFHFPVPTTTVMPYAIAQTCNRILYQNHAHVLLITMDNKMPP